MDDARFGQRAIKLILREKRAMGMVCVWNLLVGLAVGTRVFWEKGKSRPR